MSKLRVHCFALSLDGYGAGPRQDRDNPLGVGGTALHRWFYPTHTFRSTGGEKDGTTGVDDGFARRGLENIGAWIMGRNMFGPIREAWPDEEWKGWWGDDPPYHGPVFVLTHHARPPVPMQGGTTFHFVTGGIEEALRKAREAAGSKNVAWAAGSRRSASISTRVWWTRCTWRSRRCSSARESTSCPAWTCPRSDISSPSM